jgi:pimeloyl-ACP methyl ester carboxylesterase
VRLTAGLAFVAAISTACTSQSSPAPAPTPSHVADRAVTASPAGLRRFYTQQLSWHSCEESFQCASLLVPLDYAHPQGRTLDIAVIRQPASGQSEGSLIINPGGPGASGVTFEAEAAPAFSQLTDHFDLVSFDPRGVGQSDPIRCLSSAQLDAFINTDPVPSNAAEHARLVSQAKQFADACYQRNGSYLEHVGTIDQARDMDVLRAALGDAKLTYYGASYGTYLGAKYAQLFPTRIRAMVLDGALNPDESATQETLVQSEGFETDLHDSLAACVSSGSCPLGSTQQEALAAVRALRAHLTAVPLAAGDRELGAGEFFEGLAAGMYSPDDWPELWVALSNAQHGDGTDLLKFADSLTERNADGSYTNLIESNTAINCIDRPWPRNVAAYDRAAAAFAKVAPDFGAANEYSSLPCAFWRVPPVERPHPVHAPGAPPILVIGTTRDPATPYVWAKALAAQLSSGVLLTYDGDGHTAYLRHDPCVDSAVKSYLDDLMPPAAGTRCS